MCLAAVQRVHVRPTGIKGEVKSAAILLLSPKITHRLRVVDGWPLG